MAAPVCAIVTTTIGAVLIVFFGILGYVIIPSIVRNMVADEVGLFKDTIQMSRFEKIPFLLNFKVHLFEILNPDEVENNGVPIVRERGPYIYRLNRTRIIHEVEEEYISYQIKDQFIFDSEASYPNTEDDVIMMANAPYHLILQQVESDFPSLIGFVGGNIVLNGVFREFSTPFAKFRVKDLLFHGIPICTNPVLPIALIFCTGIRASAGRSENLEEQPDGTILFSFFRHKYGRPGRIYRVNRGTRDIDSLGMILSWDDSPRLHFWSDHKDENGEEEISVCNKLNGTDTGIFPPFVDITRPIYGFNTDICRSVELRFERHEEHLGIPVYRFSADEWFLSNDDGCFCLNKTQGITRTNGCLHKGAIELFTCVVI